MSYWFYRKTNGLDKKVKRYKFFIRYFLSISIIFQVVDKHVTSEFFRTHEKKLQSNQ